MTGAIITKGFDTSMQIEKISYYPNKKNPKYILINKRVGKHNHVRFAGSDYKKKELVIKKNNIILPNHILALKTLGIKRVKVKKKINILFFSTGNEISNSDKITNWKVRNTNNHYIKNLIKNFLFVFKYSIILKDNNEKIL